MKRRGGYNHPSNYKGVSKRQAQPAWRLAALIGLRVPDFLVCFCDSRDNPDSEKSLVSPRAVRHGFPSLHGRPLRGRTEWPTRGLPSLSYSSPTSFPGQEDAGVQANPSHDSSTSLALLLKCALRTFPGEPEWLIADTRY